MTSFKAQLLMKDSQILSVFQEPAPEPLVPGSPRVLVFDACQVGVVLRAVLFVEVVVGVGAIFGAATFFDWLTRLSLLTGGALPATLVWLIVACSLKKVLARLNPTVQQGAGVALGAVAGLYGCAVLSLVGLLEPAPWLACAFSGALLSAALVAALVWRAKGKTPAATAARLSELQARIRPHFLFNTLNSAIALVRAEPAKAEALLEDLSDLFRHALMEQASSSPWPMKLPWRSVIWRLNKYVLVIESRWSGCWTEERLPPNCRPCCCSRWWKTPSSTA